MDAETWAIRKQDKCIMSKETKFKITAKYIWQDYNTIEDILSEIAIHPVVKKIQNYRTKWKHSQRMDRDRLPHLIM
jgi:hypothetical protein